MYIHCIIPIVTFTVCVFTTKMSNEDDAQRYVRVHYSDMMPVFYDSVEDILRQRTDDLLAAV